jgi:hypothetical protein
MELGGSVETERRNEGPQLQADGRRGGFAHEAMNSGSKRKRYMVGASGARPVRHCERSEAIHSCFLVVSRIASLRSQ